MVPSRTFWGCVVAVAASIVITVPCIAQDSDPLLNPLFQDHLVLQRDTSIQVWGTAAPNDTVQVMMSGASAASIADDQGHWSVQLPPMDPGGPHRLVARSTDGRVQTLEDVLVGDVYLCSGQSNMELPVDRTLNTRVEINNAANDRIRMLQVAHASSPAPKNTLPTPVSWEVASSESVPDWSATCYYFARELQKHVDVPLGLLHSSWGGSSITAWMSRSALASTGQEDALSLLDRYTEDPRAAQQAFGSEWERWWHKTTADADTPPPWRPEVGTQWPASPDGLGNWRDWESPDLSTYSGLLWYRTTLDLSAKQAGRDAVLYLGAADAVDQTWINGEVVGTTFGWGTPRIYTVPAEQLQAGTNVVVLNVLSTYGSGGLLAAPPSRAVVTGTGERLPLETWQYQTASSETGLPPTAPWHPIAGQSMLHNAMLAPLHDFALRGAIWYQGESDTDEADAYQDRLRELMGQWRTQFGKHLPVLVVQLANYGSRPTSPTESSWADLREAQRLAVQNDPNAALAVTVDIGSPYDIHPANKQEVGRRLSRAGRHVVYGDTLPPSGPVPTSAERDGDGIAVTFTGVDGALVAYNHSQPVGFELCGDEDGSCYYADATINGNQVLLRSEGLNKPTRVRYCWADSPVCTLYDEAGLPAGPFELDISK